MKLTLIGVWGGYPKANGASSGYLLQYENFSLMIDFGSGVLSKMQNILNPEHIDAVILSHYHSDHIADIGVLQHARLIQKYLGKEMGTLPIYGHPFDEQQFNQLTYKDITKGVPYDPENVLKVGPFAVEFLKTKHPATCFAFRITTDGKSLVYTGDSSYQEEFISFARGADLLLCECNFYKHQDGTNAGHMNSIDAGTIAKRGNVKQLVLTHLPHYGDVTQLVHEAKEMYDGPIYLGEEGKEFII